MKQKIHVIILAGGSGSRLWPLSRKTFPKQFVNLDENGSLFQKTVSRLSFSQSVSVVSRLVITADDFRFIVKNQLNEININDSKIVIEPTQKDTAAAILSSCMLLHEEDPDASVLLMPSDHLISSTANFEHAITNAVPFINQGKIALFGVKPTRPATEYGYIELGNFISDTVQEVEAFVEKPILKVAKSFEKSISYMWNSGIFFAKASTIIQEFQNLDPSYINPTRASVANRADDIGFVRLSSPDWENIPKNSFDYAIIEKTNNLVCLSIGSDWVDLGTWSSIHEQGPRDARGNVVSDNAHVFDAKNCLLKSYDSNRIIVASDVDDITIIDTRDAVLVIKNNSENKLKKIINEMEKNGVVHATRTSSDSRPWGKFEVLESGEKYKVKRLDVNSGASLSLQSHKHRSEHWVVVNGSAEVTLGEKVFTVKSGESIYVPQHQHHRIANPFHEPLSIIEVQIGSYLEEDDIVRYEDIYERDENK